MKTAEKKILIGITFTLGFLSVVSGDYVLSSTLFASAAIASNVNPLPRQSKILKLLWD